MATVNDVAAFILRESGPMTAMKLQKLCYYSQAWHMVWEDHELFHERIEAWANGPVAPALYREHAGQFRLRSGDIPGDPEALEAHEQDSVNGVLSFYGHMSAAELSSITHAESPWIDARDGAPAGARTNNLIKRSSMAEYYGSL